MASMTDALTVLHHQHREVEELFAEAEGLQVAQVDDSRTGLVAERNALKNTIVTKLSQHAAIEELHFYPALRTALPDGDPLADHARHDHQVVKELLHQLDDISPDSVDYDALLRKLISEVRAHVRYEEEEIFPEIMEALSPRDREDIGVKLVEAMRSAPTHPHPATPVNAFTAKVGGLTDRVRDVLEHRSTAD
jgi:iron-sulfur cluster repair protein YtfE (RIC family)